MMKWNTINYIIVQKRNDNLQEVKIIPPEELQPVAPDNSTAKENSNENVTEKKWMQKKKLLIIKFTFRYFKVQI